MLGQACPFLFGGVMADIKYISDFLTRVEGPRQRRGYVPCYVKSSGKGKNYIGRAGTPDNGVEFPVTGSPLLYRAMGASGVTIATGCDLGQTDIPTLKGYGLADIELLDILKPYIGKKKDDALLKLFDSSLLISAEQACVLDNAVHKGYLDKYVRPAYDRDSKKRFDDLPEQAQAVVFSCCFQKGCGGIRRDWPKTWKYFTTQDWNSAAYELQHGFASYKGRRTVEGKLLEELL